MKQIKRFLLAVLCAAPFGGAVAAPVATTSGSNLTAYNPNVSLVGNQWAIATNPRNLNSGQKVEADFGNCNALILRCAQPKCSGTGCADSSVATSIVTGCIQANDTCKQYADQGLTEYIVGQLVASSSAKANEAEIALETAKAQAAAQQNSQQLQDMQNKMQQMQNEMANQNAATIAELKNALEEQKALNAAAQQPAQPVQDNSGSGLSTAQQIAAANNVSADILVREQVSGEILTSIENAEVQLKTLKATMYQPGGTSIFTYAGCDSTGSNCTGPKRVKRFKELANGFFDPYNSVLDEMYDALITAQSVGVDVTDIYMMLNDSCNQWGQYLCSTRQECHDEITVISYKDDPNKQTSTTEKVCKTSVYSTYTKDNCKGNKSVKGGAVKGGHECTEGMVIPPEDDMYCTLQKTLSEKDGEIQRQWLYAEQGDLGDNVRVGCASSALDSVALFRNRKKKSNLDIETLQRMINQDAPATCYKDNKADPECIKWCQLTDDSKQKVTGFTISKNLDANICLENLSLASGVKCSGDEDEKVTPYVIPELALCSVHVYNVGKTSNTDIKDATERSNMNDVIALKTTVITQQMYKQYEYLESMIKRFKTQLKKAVLTAKVQMANGDSNSSSSGSSSGYSSNIDRRNGVYLSEVKNCREEIGVPDIIECLRHNYNEMNSKYKDSSISSDLKKQLTTDHEILNDVFEMIIVTEDYKTACTYIKNSKCSNKNMSSSDIKTCLSDLSTNLTKARTCYDLSQRQFQTK